MASMRKAVEPRKPLGGTCASERWKRSSARSYAAGSTPAAARCQVMYASTLVVLRPAPQSRPQPARPERVRDDQHGGGREHARGPEAALAGRGPDPGERAVDAHVGARVVGQELALEAVEAPRHRTAGRERQGGQQ